MVAQHSVHPANERRGKKSRTAGMPSAHALGLGDGRLTLPRPMSAFLEVGSELWRFPFPVLSLPSRR
jgi:hypothetical protein